MDLVKKIDKLIGNGSNVKAGATRNKGGKKATIDWGFDLTDFGSPANFRKLLRFIGAKAKPQHVVKGSPIAGSDYKYREFHWKGKGVTLVTACDPIKGEMASGEKGPHRLGYASYMGLTGEAEAVRETVAAIKQFAAGGIKDESPYKRDFI